MKQFRQFNFLLRLALAFGYCLPFFLKAGETGSARPDYWLDPPELRSGENLIELELTASTEPIEIDAEGKDVRIWQRSGVVARHIRIRIENPRRVYAGGIDWRPTGESRQVVTLKFQNVIERVHMERSRIDMSRREYVGVSGNPAVGRSGDVMRWDGTGSSYPTLIWQGIQIWDMRGTAGPNSAPHADWLQQDGDTGDVHLYDISGSTNYQAILAVPLSSGGTPTFKGKFWRWRNINIYSFGGRQPYEDRMPQPYYLKAGTAEYPQGNPSRCFDLSFENGTIWYHHGWPARDRWATPVNKGYSDPDTINWNLFNNAVSPFYPQGSSASYGSELIEVDEIEAVRFQHVSGNLETGWADTSIELENEFGGFPMNGETIDELQEVPGFERAYVMVGKPPQGYYCTDDMVGPDSTAYASSTPGELQNIAIGKPVEADSSAGPAAGPENAVDGQTESGSARWISGDGPFPHRIEIDLQDRFFVSGFQLFKVEGDELTDYVFEGFDGSGWVLLADFQDDPDNTRHVFPETILEKVRVTFSGKVEVASDNAARLYEWVILGQPFVEAPVAPDQLRAETLSDSEIHLTWNDNSDNEALFILEFREEGNDFTLYPVRPEADQTSLTVTGLLPETTYDFRVFAANRGGDSDPSAEASATTRPAPVNAALGKPVHVDTQYGEAYGPGNLVDGDTESRASSWLSGDGGFPHSVEIDLGAVFAISEVRLYFWEGFELTDYIIESYYDGTWFELATASSDPGDGLHVFESALSERIRIKMRAEVNGNAIARLYEIEVMGLENGPARDPLSLWADIEPEANTGAKHAGIGWILDVHYPYIFHYSAASWMFVYPFYSQLESMFLYDLGSGEHFWTAEAYGGWHANLSNPSYGIGGWADWTP